MVNKENLIDLGNKFAKENAKLITNDANDNNRVEETEQIDPEKRVVLFFSFDVVNSTAYKTINYFGWAQVLNQLFKKLRDDVRNKIIGSEMWRVLGDEAIFVVNISDEDELREKIDCIYKILIETIKELKNGEYFNDYDDRNKQLMCLQNILSLQASAWIASVRNVGDLNSPSLLWDSDDNIFEKYNTNENRIVYEFLGNDIDAGFRISKQTCDGRLALSFELAFLISKATETSSYLHIITYKKLKGVWKEKLYPIIWYHNPKRMQDIYGKELSFEESLSFDATDDNILLKEYYENRDNKDNLLIRDNKMFTDSYYALQKIMKDRNLNKKIDTLNSILKETKSKTNYITTEFLQMHCVAVCYKYENEPKILIAERTSTRDNLAGLWEFGCAKAVLEENITERIMKEYKEDFGIDIEPIINNNRNDKEPIPLAIYQVPDKRIKEKMHKGIITYAKIIGDFKPECFIKTKKHQELRWITENDLENIESNYSNHVNDFKETIEMVFKAIKEKEKGCK